MKDKKNTKYIVQKRKKKNLAKKKENVGRLENMKYEYKNC